MSSMCFEVFCCGFLSGSGKAGSAGLHMHEGLKPENSLLTYKHLKVLYESLKFIHFIHLPFTFADGNCHIALSQHENQNKFFFF